ncbi:MAG: peptidoglycan-binding protein [Coriobacteriia bacterium]|nr:peptidoglycan-binding protein [Coriobacteriia bacterium]
MKPVRVGDRGPAVEDIQRRLLALGYDLGRTGVDGVFLGETTHAVQSFQLKHGLEEDGLVGDRTWSALVDASFALGDRMLYLRLPHFHGHDVTVLQQALNALGFACGAVDGILGSFTERALREFQRNAGLNIDGIVGPNTVRTITNLRHVWLGKDANSHSGARTAPARAVEVLERAWIAVAGDDAAGEEVARRLVNLAHASTERAQLHGHVEGEQVPRGGVVMRVCCGGSARAEPGRPVVHVSGHDGLVARLLTALEAAAGQPREVVIEFEPQLCGTELADQQAAVLLLDAVCAAFD